MLRWAFASLIAVLLLLGLAFASAVRAEAPAPTEVLDPLPPDDRTITCALFDVRPPAVSGHIGRGG